MTMIQLNNSTTFQQQFNNNSTELNNSTEFNCTIELNWTVQFRSKCRRLFLRTLKGQIFAGINFRESKKIAFRGYLFSRITFM